MGMSLQNLVNAIKNSIGPDEDPSSWVYKEEVLMPLDQFLLDTCRRYKKYEFRLSREETLQNLLLSINEGGTTGLSRRKLALYLDSLGTANSRSSIMIYKVVDNAAHYLFGLLGDDRCSQAISMLQDELDPEYKKLFIFERDMNRSLNSARKKRVEYNTAIAEIPYVNNLGRDVGIQIAKFTQPLTKQQAINIMDIDTFPARRGRNPSGVKPLTTARSGGYRKSRKGRKSRRKGRKSRKH